MECSNSLIINNTKADNKKTQLRTRSNIHGVFPLVSQEANFSSLKFLKVLTRVLCTGVSMYPKKYSNC